MPQTRRTDADMFDLAIRLLRAQAAAEQEAVRHVQFLRNMQVPLKEAAEAIGLDPDNVRSWDDVTMASHHSHGGPSSAPSLAGGRDVGLRCNGACQSAG